MPDINIAAGDSPMLEIAASESVAVDIDVPDAPSLSIGAVTVSVPGPQGEDGSNGKSAYQIAVDNGFVGTERKWLESLRGSDGNNGQPGRDGQDGRDIQLRSNGTHIQWAYNNSQEWHNIVPLSAITGARGSDGVGAPGRNGTDGREVELRKTATHIQWRYKNGSWADLVLLSELGGGTDINSVTPEQASIISGPLIAGTQTRDTGDWTGVAPFSELRHGQRIVYLLPRRGSGNASLRLTLSGGNTTENIPIYRGYNWRLTTHYPQGSVVPLIYLENPEGAQTGWFTAADYDSNTNWQLRHNNAIKMKTAAANRSVIVGDSSGYSQAKAGASFDISYPVMVLLENRTAGQISGAAYLAIDGVDARITKAGYSGTEYHMLYLVGTVSGNRFTIDSTIFTNTITQAEDGKVYIPIGIQYSKTHFYFRTSRELYWFKDGKVQDYTPVSGVTRYDQLQGTPDLNALKAQTLSEVHIDSTNKVSNGVITSGKLDKGTFNRGSYNETTGVINQQYGRLVTELIPARSGNYLILASFDQNQWKNGASMDCTVVVKINEDTVQRATFNTTNWHFGMTQLMRSLKSTDRVIAEVEAGQAIEVQSTIRLSLIPLEAF